MTLPDINAIYAAAYTRLASDSAGSAVRAALGGAGSVIDVLALKGTLPTAPLIAFEGGAINRTAEDVFDLPFGWWLIDSPLYGYRRLNALVPLIMAAYPHDWGVGFFTGLAPSPKEEPDLALTMNVRALWFTVSVRR